MAANLLEEFEPEIESFTLIPSDGGCYELTIDGKLIFSKLEMHRHAEPGEVAGLVRKYLASNPQ